MEDKKLTVGQVGIALVKWFTQLYYERLEQNSGSKLNAIKTCSIIASHLVAQACANYLVVQSCHEERYGPIPPETVELAQRFSLYYCMSYWDNYPEHVPEFEAAILNPEHTDLPPHTKAELKQLNELLTNRLNTPDVAEWSLEEMRQALSLALSTFHVMGNKHLWKELTKYAL